MPNPQHPAKLLVLDPVRTTKGYCRKLSARDATLVVELTPDQRFTFALSETCKLGLRSYARCLIDLAADLTAGYTIALAKPGALLDELEDLARTPRDRHPARRGRGCRPHDRRTVAPPSARRDGR